jgi:hypothetical protein
MTASALRRTILALAIATLLPGCGADRDTALSEKLAAAQAAAERAEKAAVRAEAAAEAAATKGSSTAFAESEEVIIEEDVEPEPGEPLE